MTAWRIGVEFNPLLIGGTENFLRRLFRHLDSTRFAPVALASAPGRWQKFLAGVAETHVVPYLHGADAPAEVTGALHELRLDLVQSSYFAPVIAFAAAQLRLPHVWRLGGHVRVLERSESERRKLLSIVQLTSQRVICPSQFLADQFATTGAPAIDVINNGLSLDEIGPPESGRDTASPGCVAMLAHLVHTKRPDVFLHAAAIVAARRPATRFFLFGGSFPTAEMRAYAQSVRDLARNLGLDGVLTVRELERDRFATLREIDVFAMPVENEGCSNAVLEAMALGKPVVAVRSGSNAELIDDRVTGVLVAPGDANALAESVLALLDDPRSRAALGAAARKTVERRFDIRVCAQRYEALYTNVLGASSGQRE
jgi:glycosyltransferase involved in cell wall biosynthesis